jgi:hypothetical protein
MIVQIIQSLTARVETIGMVFNGFALDGSSEAAQCVWGRVDPDHIRNTGLSVGIEYGTVSDPRILGRYANPVTRNIGTELLPVWQTESNLENVRRELEIHLYMNENRVEEARVTEFDADYLTNEARLKKVFRAVATRDTLTIDGVDRDFVLDAGRVVYRSEPDIARHGVLLVAVEYPLTTSLEIEEIYLAEAVTLRGVTAVPLPDPLDVYPEFEITV